jgi:DNA-binding Xre family transcriptional regulator
MLIILTILVEFNNRIGYSCIEVMRMFKLKLDVLMTEKRYNARQLSEATGIRWNTIDDMKNNRSKAWNVENLNRIAEVLGLESAEELIEYVKETAQ